MAFKRTSKTGSAGTKFTTASSTTKGPTRSSSTRTGNVRTTVSKNAAGKTSITKTTTVNGMTSRSTKTIGVAVKQKNPKLAPQKVTKIKAFKVPRAPKIRKAKIGKANPILGAVILGSLGLMAAVSYVINLF